MKPSHIAALAALAFAAAPALASWTFERGRDDMTGTATCLAVSPVQYLQTGARQEVAPVRLVISVVGSRVIAAIRVDTQTRGLLHPDASGSGIKVEPGTFHPTAARAQQSWAQLADSGKAIDELLLGKSVRLRVKFWPYERLVDSAPISTAGLPQAVVRVAECGDPDEKARKKGT